jgi:hypothetical protein
VPQCYVVVHCLPVLILLPYKMFQNIFRSDKCLTTVARDPPCNACRSSPNVVFKIVRYQSELKLLDMLWIIPSSTDHENSFSCTRVDWCTQADRQTDRLTDRQTDWQTDRLTDWQIDWLTDWLTDWPDEFRKVYNALEKWLNFVPSRPGTLIIPNPILKLGPI